jgi:hypothetical protein
MQLNNLRLSQVLYMVMNEASGPDIVLAYRASGNLLILSTASDLGKELVVRVYDVSDLLLRAPRFTNAPMMDLSSQQSGGQGGMGGSGGQNIFGGQGGSRNDEGDRSRDDDANIQELIDLIRNTIEPDSWQENGGLGSIHSFGKLLVVRNNLLVHQALGEYVEERD